jgi:hypothetical protein
MNQSARNALIAAVTALLVAGATVWVIEKGKRTEDEQDAKGARQELEAAADQIAQASVAGAAGAHDPIYVKSMTAIVTAGGEPNTAQDGPVKADLCLLTSVGSYGGATKGCTLTRGNEGWKLVANARRTTSACQATCFDFRPGPNGPPSP